MEFKYKVQISYLYDGKRVYRERVYSAGDCQWAANMARSEYGRLEGMRVERVWKETATGSWMAVNAWE